MDWPVELANEVVELFMLLLGFSLCAQERKAETEITILVNTSLMSFLFNSTKMIKQISYKLTVQTAFCS
jgi:hypothetical protein